MRIKLNLEYFWGTSQFLNFYRLRDFLYFFNSRQPKFPRKKRWRKFSWSRDCPSSKLLKLDLVYLLNTFGDPSLRIFAAGKASLVQFKRNLAKCNFNFHHFSLFKFLSGNSKKSRKNCENVDLRLWWSWIVSNVIIRKKSIIVSIVLISIEFCFSSLKFQFLKGTI